MAKILENKTLEIIEGRHPVVETQMKLSENSFISNDCILNKDDFLWLITGPNMAGKSTYLRQNALIVIMAQAGLWVPCKNMNFFPYKKIFTRILGNDDLFKGLSTFAVEMCELRTILNHSDQNSLIIGDEVCSGTESNSAKSIFTAAIEWLHNKNSSFIFATHLHKLNEINLIKDFDNIRFLFKKMLFIT